MSTTIYIKGMVCVRCVMAVQDVLKSNHIPYSRIELGWAELESSLNNTQQTKLEEGLKHYQLQLMQDKTQILMERIKTEIIHLLHKPQSLQLKLSAHLSQQLGYNYTYLANTFSDLEGMTLERYFITQRIERVKELIVYEDLSLTEITHVLQYSSVSHLCLQFKKVTGITPADFKKKCQSGNYAWRAI